MYKATKLARKLAQKLHAHSVQYAYKLSSTRRALEKTPHNSSHQDQARATASNPPDPHRLVSFVSLGERNTRCLGPTRCWRSEVLSAFGGLQRGELYEQSVRYSGRYGDLCKGDGGTQTLPSVGQRHP
eukprot:1144727-Pelagomonas_calceolata.AAC.1